MSFAPSSSRTPPSLRQCLLLAALLHLLLVLMIGTAPGGGAPGASAGWRGFSVTLGGLLATGIAMADHFALWSSDTLRIKLTLVGVLIVLTLVHLRFPRAHALQGVIFLVTLAVVWFGVDLAN